MERAYLPDVGGTWVSTAKSEALIHNISIYIYMPITTHHLYPLPPTQHGTKPSIILRSDVQFFRLPEVTRATKLCPIAMAIKGGGVPQAAHQALKSSVDDGRPEVHL